MSTPKLEGLKLPGIRSIFEGIFADHITWIYEPSSILMMIASYYSHKFVYDRKDDYGLDSKWAFNVSCWMINVLIWWVLAIIFLVLDYVTGEKGKQYKQRTTISVRRMIPVVLRNHFLHLTIGMLTSILHNMVIPKWSERTYFDPLVFLAKFWTVKLMPVIIQSVNILTRLRSSEFKAGRHRILLTMNRWIRTPESTE